MTASGDVPGGELPGGDVPGDAPGEPVGAQAWNNGLLAASYVPLTDVTLTLAPRVLSALERARIAAYFGETSTVTGSLRLYVASGERADARTIVAAVVRDSDMQSVEAGPDRSADPLAGIDADAEFAALIADWHVDTHTAIRNAERDLSRDDEDWRMRLNQHAAQSGADEELTWLDEDHYVPPNPPPIPRPTAPIVGGLLLVALAIVLLAFGALIGMQFPVRLFLAVSAILGAAAIFVLRLGEHGDEDDDGAVL